MKQKVFLLFPIFLLLFSGWILFQVINGGSFMIDSETGFHLWLWEKRSLDLAVQIVLVFAGALGIAAILPMEAEDDE